MWQIMVMERDNIVFIEECYSLGSTILRMASMLTEWDYPHTFKLIQVR